MNQPASESLADGRRSNVRVAAVQMVSTPRVEENLKTAETLIAQAVRQGAQLVALPEYFPIMGRSDADKFNVCEADGRGMIQDFLAATARRKGIWLVGGSIPLVSDEAGKMLNSCLVYDPQGGRVARYDKIHLFGFQKGSERYNESATIEAGSTPVTFETPFARVGVSICYDIRFPELYRAQGAVDLQIIPAAFTETTGRAHWEILLRARAIENQCYVLAVAQGGRHENGRETHGNSMLIDPWGVILDRLPKGPGVVIGEVDHARIADVRASLPALTHRVM